MIGHIIKKKKVKELEKKKVEEFGRLVEVVADNSSYMVSDELFYCDLCATPYVYNEATGELECEEENERYYENGNLVCLTGHILGDLCKDLSILMAKLDYDDDLTYGVNFQFDNDGCVYCLEWAA